MPQEITIRQMHCDDIPFGIELSQQAGWNQLEADWREFLRLGAENCFVAAIRDEPAGTVTTIRYGSDVGWIGMLLVARQFRRRGVGSRLLEVATAALSQCRTQGLDATPEGREVYRQRGFIDGPRITRWLRRAGQNPDTESAASDGSLPAVRDLEEVDLRSISSRDGFPADRSCVLESLHRRSPARTFTLSSGAPAVGFGRSGHHADQVGPIIARAPSDAIELLRHSVHLFADRPLLIDAETHSEAWAEDLQALGFREVRHFIRMYKGPPLPEASTNLATSGPEWG